MIVDWKTFWKLPNYRFHLKNTFKLNRKLKFSLITWNNLFKVIKSPFKQKSINNLIFFFKFSQKQPKKNLSIQLESETCARKLIYYLFIYLNSLVDFLTWTVCGALIVWNNQEIDEHTKITPISHNNLFNSHLIVRL